MKLKLIYPKWPKLDGQTEFHLPPHGPVVFAASLPKDVEVAFIDENLESIDFDAPVDLVAISMMLTVQVKRGWQIADTYRRKGVKVIFGGIATMLHAEETMDHADAVFLGESEGKMEKVFADFKKNQLAKVYDFLEDRPPIDKAIEEMAGIDNNRLFIGDNSLAQDIQWELDLFREMIPLKKNWCSHPIEDKAEVLDLAAQAGAWYVYQAVFDTSNLIRERIKRYHDHGIGVEGTILLGLDDHTEDFIKRLVDFLLEIELDLAEFTVLTPFPHTKAYDDLKQQDRINSYDWNDYSADKVVYQPKHMSAEKLQQLLHFAWETFYKDESQELKMFKLFQRVIEREMANNTFKPRDRALAARAFGKEV
jgi:radical SAM superfamily enzyme YgiQ (UPF0313 family)